MYHKQSGISYSINISMSEQESVYWVKYHVSVGPKAHYSSFDDD